jgi:dipeptidyl aminopeptidase/acylaminoacyl peptidase
MTRALTLDDLYRLPTVSDPQLSPDGARVAYVLATPDRDEDRVRTAIWVVDVDGAQSRQLTFGDADSSPRWSPDGRWLAFVATRPGGPEAPQVWLLPTAGGEARRLTDVDAGASEPVWSPDGQRIAFLALLGAGEEHAPVVVSRLDYKADGAGLIAGRRQHLHVVDVDGGEPTQLTEGDYSVAFPAWSPEGREVVFAASRQPDPDLDLGSALHAISVDGGEPRVITPAGGMAFGPAFTPDGQTVVFVGADAPGVGHSRLFRVDAAGGKPVEIAPDFDRNIMVGAPGYPGGVPAITADGRTVLFCARDRGCTHLFAVDLDGGPVRGLVGGHDRVVNRLSLAGDRVAFVLATPTTSGEVAVASVDGGGEQTLTDHVAPELEGVDVVVPQPREFVAPDGVRVHGWVIRRDGAEGPGPLLLDIHGGPHNAWNPVFDPAHLYHQVLVAQGWTVLLPNTRGSDGYGEQHYTALTGGWGRNDLDDFLGAVDTLVDEGVADPQRLALTGYSYGGYMTNWITTQTDRFAAAVSGGCLSNLVSFTGTSDVGHGLATFELRAAGAPDDAQARALSPLTYVDNVTTPTLILHGERDDRCPVEQAEEWFAALRVRGQTVELVRYPGGSHLFIVNGRLTHRVDYAQRVIDWVTRHAR